MTVRDLDAFVPAFKIASGDNDWPDLLRAVAATAKPVILSTGLLDLAGARESATAVTKAWADGGHGNPGLCVLHCVSAYPCPEDETNLRALDTLAGLGFPVGYSDHTLGIDAAVSAVVLGAKVIEKHFTLDHNQSDFRDHALSADPSQMSELVRRIRLAERMMGDGVKRVMPSEKASLVGARRGAAVSRDLPAGHVLAAGDIAWLRPREAFGPRDAGALIGRTLKAAKAAGTHLVADDLSN
jgi:sialic acid synthase SpsE